ncbi:MAG TPA: cytochrome c oxidase subunit 3 family protein [Candidatus Binatia bacterium]|jgi:cytochrome c oxidase subunit 3
MNSAVPAAPEALHPRAEQFEDLEQQHHASWLGMWVFLATEVMFFGGMFTAYTFYRVGFPEAFAEASNRLDVVLGAINTSVLISSSFTMALAVHSAENGRNKAALRFLVATMFLGAVFLCIKFYEYYQKYVEYLIPGPFFRFEGPHARPAEIFLSLYFAMTGLHAVHMIIGIGLLAWLAVKARHERFSAAYYTPVELGGLYWHFVDLIWIFLFPLLYLVGRHL